MTTKEEDIKKEMNKAIKNTMNPVNNEKEQIYNIYFLDTKKFMKNTSNSIQLKDYR